MAGTFAIELPVYFGASTVDAADPGTSFTAQDLQIGDTPLA
jgi:hypothetical protein